VNTTTSGVFAAVRSTREPFSSPADRGESKDAQSEADEALSGANAVAHYVVDLFRSERPLLSRSFEASTDAEAIAQAEAAFSVDVAEDRRINRYRLRNPMPGSDRIFHEGSRRQDSVLADYR
jgi:hypothetical protein